MDALDLLTADHDRVRGLFRLYEQASEGRETERRRDLVGRIIRELQVHTALEERLFYPEVRGIDGEIDAEVAEGLQEHHVAEELMDELMGMDAGGGPRGMAAGGGPMGMDAGGGPVGTGAGGAMTDDETWTAKVKVLIETIEHHAGEEEEDLFPAVRSRTTAEERRGLAERMEGLKREMGAPTLADKIDLTTKELASLAREQDIPGRSKMTKERLAATVAPPGM